MRTYGDCPVVKNGQWLLKTTVGRQSGPMGIRLRNPGRGDAPPQESCDSHRTRLQQPPVITQAPQSTRTTGGAIKHTGGQSEKARFLTAKGRLSCPKEGPKFEARVPLPGGTFADRVDGVETDRRGFGVMVSPSCTREPWSRAAQECPDASAANRTHTRVSAPTACSRPIAQRRTPRQGQSPGAPR